MPVLAIVLNPSSSFRLHVLQIFCFVTNGSHARISPLLASHERLGIVAQPPHPEYEVAVPLWQRPAQSAWPGQRGVWHPLLGCPAYADWVQYGKVMQEFFQVGVGSDTSLLNMLILVDKHPELLGAS